MGINPSEITDVNDWIEAYSQADYLLKLKHSIYYTATKKALHEIVSQVFGKEDEEIND